MDLLASIDKKRMESKTFIEYNTYCLVIEIMVSILKENDFFA